MVGSARLYVCAHTTKRFIVAIKYEEEETYRSLIASALRWRTRDIVQGHTLRWLVEVFIQDWKSYEGWSQLTKQPGDEGARHSVILSLLVDHKTCSLKRQHEVPKTSTNTNSIILKVSFAIAEAMHQNVGALHATNRMLDEDANLAQNLISDLLCLAQLRVGVLLALARLLGRDGDPIAMVVRLYAEIA
jgi:hypothetical protein